MSNRPNRRQYRGFTLVESIATIVVLAALGSIASMILMGAVDGYSQAATTAQLHGELSSAMDRIERELRYVGRKAGATDAPDISALTASSINWHSNSRLYLSGDQLLFINAGAAAQVLLQDVASFSVQAFDESNNALPATLSGSGCDAIRRLQITITLQRHGVSHTLRTKLFLRALMEGGAEP